VYTINFGGLYSRLSTFIGGATDRTSRVGHRPINYYANEVTA